MQKSTFNTLFIQLSCLLLVAIAAYFVAVENGLNLLEGNYTVGTFKGVVVLIILGAFIATSFIFLYAYRLASSKQKIYASLMHERQVIEAQNVELGNLRKSIDSMRQGITIIGKDDRIQWVNNGFTKMFGYPLEECIGKPSSALVAGPLTNTNTIAIIDQSVFARKEQVSVEVVHYRKDQSHFWARLYVSPIVGDSGELEKYIAVSEDITDEVEAKQRLQESEHNFQLIADTIHDTFYLYSIPEGKYDFINPKCEAILGVPAERFYEGTNNEQMQVHEDDRTHYENAISVASSGASYTIEYRVRIGDQWRWVRESSTPILNDEGEVIKRSGVCSDITDRKRSELELMQKSLAVTESIQYAQRIQRATLTNSETISQIFDDYTLFYQPRDIVSGDFYDVSTIKQNDGTALKSIVVADCTGHGIPGALLATTCSTIVQSTFSNKNINSPAEALEFCRTAITNLFRHSKDTIQDGMDIGWLVYDEQAGEYWFSGAQSDCYIVRDNKTHRIQGDRTAAANSEPHAPFTIKREKAEKGDLVFLTTDGYLDQFGGQDDRKFTRKRFVELLPLMSNKPLKGDNTLAATFNEWKGDSPQIDDICVLGVRI